MIIAPSTTNYKKSSRRGLAKRSSTPAAESTWHANTAAARAEVERASQQLAEALLAAAAFACDLFAGSASLFCLFGSWD